MDLSIIVVNWNTGKLLVECLRSVYRFTKFISFEIIVVDNASSDDSLLSLQAQFPEVKLIRNRHNVGFAKANNQAYLEAKGKYICCLNPDTELLNNALEMMCDCLDNHVRCAIVGPKLLTPDRTIQYVCARRYPSMYTSFVWITGLNQLWPHMFEGENLENWDHQNSRSVDCVAGACMVFRRDFLKDNLIFNDSYFMFGEDVDACLHAKRRGYTVHYLSDAEVMHYSQQSVKKNRDVTIHYCISMFIYYRENFGIVKALAFRSLLVVVMSLRMFFPGSKRLHLKILSWAIGIKRITAF